MARKIELIPYDPAWPDLFLAEARKIGTALGEEMLSIHHIGSTAVPGTKAKPIIDILAAVRDINKIDALNGQMVGLGYEPRGEFGIPGRRFFVKDKKGIRTHNLHVFQADSPELARHVDFRDYLRAQPDVAQTYSRLKQELANKFGEDREGYTEAKTPFIRAIEQKAREWKKSSGR